MKNIRYLKFLTQATLYLSALLSCNTALANEQLPSITTKKTLNAALTDWRPTHQNDDQPPCICEGEFVEPYTETSTNTATTAQQPIDIDANSAFYTIGSDTINFQGAISGQQGLTDLSSDFLSYNKDSQYLELMGNVKIRQPGALLLGEHARLSRTDNSAELKKASYLFHDSHANGSAEEIKRTKNGQISLHDASYTMCVPGDNFWSLRAEDITLDPNSGEGFAYHTRLYIKDVPIMYLPFFNFPLNDKRKSGFLFPSYASVDGGADISVPYYLNLAANYDATITPRYVSGHGPLLETQARYLGHKNQAQLSAGYLPNERTYDSENPNNDTKQRWLFAFKEDGHFDQQRRFTHKVDTQRVSDDEYLEDLGASGLDVRRAAQLKSDAQLNYQAKHWDANLYVESYQELEDDLDSAYRRLPQLAFNYYKNYNSGIYTNLGTEYAYFDNPDDDNNSVGQRIYFAPELGYQKTTTAGNFNIKTGFKSVDYDLRKNPSDFSNPNTFSPNIKLEGALFFDRTLDNGNVQTLQPQIQYYYADHQEQELAPNFDTILRTESYTQLFNEERFTGRDRISDANRITLGVNTRISTTDNELFEMGIAQQYFLDQRSVSAIDPSTLNDEELRSQHRQLSRNSSNIASYINYNSGQRWRLSSEQVFNPDIGNFDSISFNYHASSDKFQRQIFNVGYEYKKDANRFIDNPFIEDDLHQLNVSTVFKATDKMSIIALSNYDLASHQSREDLIGIEYNSCCWLARLAYHKEEDIDTSPSSGNIDYEHAIRLEVQLKGLAAISDNITRLLSESIEGFDTREQHLY